VLVWSAVAVVIAWHNCDQPSRRDGNFGHANIDFCGQWLLGRLLVQGHGRQLYDRTVQRQALEAVLPVEDQAPEERDSDVVKMMYWMMGSDEPDASDAHVGGPLYPPIQALFCSPLGLLPPRPAYRLVQFLHLGLALLCGWLIRNLSGRRIWWPVAIVLVFAFPGFDASMNLGQNAAWSLVLLLAGWWQLCQGRPGRAGVVWGFLAFKPVWAVSFFLVPLLTRRWRMATAMALTGLALIVLTLPLVGWHVWLDWLKVGRMASERYRECETWIILSRDLSGLLRRWLLDFDQGYATNPDRPLPTWLGMSLWLTLVAATVVVIWKQRHEQPPIEGPAAAFVLLGAWLSCYHFMYYDVLLAALPVMLLFTEPRQLLDLKFLCLSDKSLSPELLSYYQPHLRRPPALPLLPSGMSSRWVWNSTPLTLLVLLDVLSAIAFAIDPSGHAPPVETFCLLALWAWCGWQWLRSEPGAPRPEA
jgi:hypothetical protein